MKKEKISKGILDLTCGLQFCYHKPNKTLHYIQKLFNQPRSTIDNLVRNILLRIAKLSANKQIFNENVEHHDEAGKRSGFND